MKGGDAVAGLGAPSQVFVLGELERIASPDIFPTRLDMLRSARCKSGLNICIVDFRMGPLSVRTYTAESIRQIVGTEVGVSDWVTISQSMADQFAALTGDPVEIHTNVELAKRTPFGRTIAHGLLSLSMLGGFVTAAPVIMEGITMGLNYGFNKVRFIAPVKTGSRLRGRFFLRSMENVSPGKWLSTMDVTIEIEGEEKPAVVAEWLGMQFAK